MVDELFIKHRADIGCCTTASVELEPVSTPDPEDGRRVSQDEAERVNQEVRNLLALWMIQLSPSPGIEMVKTKIGEMQFCCHFWPLNEIIIQEAYILPLIDESLSRRGKAKIYTS